MKKPKRMVQLFAVMIAIMISASACSKTTEPTESESSVTTALSDTPESTASSDDEKAVVYAMASAWDKLMPYNGASGTYGDIVFDKIYDKLVYVTGDYDIEPRAAKSWEVAEDGMSITFHLDENSKWHDGEPVTSADWVFTFRTMTDPEVASARRSTFNIFEGTDDLGVELSENSVGIEAPDDYTFILKFKSPMESTSFLMTTCRYFHVIPEHLLKDVPMAAFLEDDFWLAPVGSGPCKYVSEISGSELTLAVNEDYQLGAAGFDKLIIRVVASDAIITGLMAGDIDYCINTATQEDSINAAQNENINVVKGEATQLMQLCINNQTVNNATFRTVLNYAIDKDLIVEAVMAGEAVATESLIIPTSEYKNPDVTPEYNVEKAIQLVAESGWDTATKLVMGVPSGFREKIAVILQQEFAAIGVEIELVTGPSSTIIAGMRNAEYDFSLIGYNGSDDPLFNAHYFNPNRQNESVISDPKYYDLLTEISHEIDPVKRKQLVFEFQELCQEDHPYIYLYHQYLFYLTSARLTGCEGTDQALFNDAVWNWSVE